MPGYLRHNFSLAPSSLKLLLYKTLVRPKLEYSCSVWDLGTEILISALEAIQNRSARFILSNYHRTSSDTSVKSILSLPPLSTQRIISRLCLFHKIYFNNSTLKSQLINHPTYIAPRSDHHCKVGIPTCKTNSFYSSFIPKTSSEWNRLPPCIATISDFFKILRSANVLLLMCSAELIILYRVYDPDSHPSVILRPWGYNK